MEIILLLALITIIAVHLEFRARTKREKLEDHAKIQQTQNEIYSLRNENSSLTADNTSLSQYRGLLDIEGKGKEIMQHAEDTSNLLIDRANAVLNNAKVENDRIQSNLKAEIEVTQTRCKVLLEESTINASKIVEEAKVKALEIAGDAIDAKEKMLHYEKTAKAMKNLVEGYGDQYLIPTYSLLDDLAEEFGYTEAGIKLAAAREESKRLIKLNLAATCDYVEVSRRGTAVNFVLDAFNGKVDSILSKVKKDNYGTLKQKIKDAYHIVNNNGKAFKNALIAESYLESRLEELKWAVSAQELKFQEQEEQRRIREQIREEEKARRDFEKAMKEAEREEQTLKKLVEKAQKDAAAASEGQKADYEAKLKDLELRLKEAEEKNVRALSMAQQTKCGNVYVISNIGSFGEDVFKIGLTRRLDPLDRVRELGDASVPFEFDVHAMIYNEDAPALERELHKRLLRLQINKVNPRKEFFKVSILDIKKLIESMNITVKWTLSAEAKQYRESMAVEKRILNDKSQAAEWERQQLLLDPVQQEEREEVI
jgi:hypothetical protein